jgi:hypothetical protein
MLTTGIERLEGMANHKSRKDGSILRNEFKEKSNSCLKSIQNTRKNALTFDINSSSQKRHPVQAILNIPVLISKALYQFFNQFQTLIEFTRVTLAWSVIICVQDKSLKKKKSLPVEGRKLSESSLYRVKDLVMFIGDRVTEKRQDHYINVCIANEDFTLYLLL